MQSQSNFRVVLSNSRTGSSSVVNVPWRHRNRRSLAAEMKKLLGLR